MLLSAEYMDLPFAEAIRFFRQKINLPTRTWSDLERGMHSRAFTVAGAVKGELLSDLRVAVDKAVSEGTTLDRFRKDFDGIVAKHGWKYKGGRGWRTATIFNTNLATSYSAGHFAAMTDPAVLKARPYWRYVASVAREPREEHKQWYNLVLPADHEFWKTHFPPCAFGCKCGVISASPEEVEQLKKKNTDGPYPVKTQAPKEEFYEYTNKTTGEVRLVPKGIDPGWDYNPGEAAWGRTQALKMMESQGKWRDLDSWGPAAYNRPDKIEIDPPKAEPTALPDKSETSLRDGLRRAVGGDEAAFKDPSGEYIMVTQAIVDHMLEKPKSRIDGRESFFPLIPELIQDPYEIWVGFAENEVSGRVAVRRRYVKAVRLGKNKVLGLWAETMNGMWVSGDFFRGDLTGAKNLRKGRLLYARK